jgi:hypothetical protein
MKIINDPENSLQLFELELEITFFFFNERQNVLARNDF